MISDGQYLEFPLRPYLCHVPGDLQQELSHLRTDVFPHLDSLCQARGTCFHPVDLQQTTLDRDDTECKDSGGDHHIHRGCKFTALSDQQLKISMDLIDRLTFFICVLGHRYGPFLLEEDGSKSKMGPCILSEVARNLQVAAKAGYPWVMEDQYRSCSLTELEITKAAFIDNHRRCFFYFKDYTPQDDKDESSDEMLIFLNLLSTQSKSERQRMRALKKRIIDSCLPVRFFRNLQELGELIRRDWEGLINQLYGNLEYPISGCQDSFEMLYHKNHACALCDWFVPSTKATESLHAFHKFVCPVTSYTNSETHSKNPGAHFSCGLDNNKSEKSILLLCGARGCGKSTLAAWWLQTFSRQNPDVPVISHFCGISVSSTDIRSVFRLWTAELQRMQYGHLPDWDESLAYRAEPEPLYQVMQKFIAAGNLRPCIILLDGIDLLTETFGLSLQEVKELGWLPCALPPSCKLIITTTYTDLTYKSLTGRTDVQILSCPELSGPCVQRCILLKHVSLPCKELPTNLLKRIVGKKLCHLPVFLALLGTEMRTCAVQREKEEEEELMEDYIEVDSIPELWMKVIYRWIKDYSNNAPARCKITGASPGTVSTGEDLIGWVWDMLCLIHVSRAGLTEAQVLALLEDLGYRGSQRVGMLEWARLRSVLGPWVQEKANGLLTIMHQSLSHSLNLLLLRLEGHIKNRKYFHQILADFFQKSSLDICSWLRKIEEVPWHLKQTGSFKDLHDFLTNPATMEFLSSSLKQYPHLTADVAQYWTVLQEKGFDPDSSFHNLMERVIDAHPLNHSSTWRSALFCSRVLLCLGETQQAEELLLHADNIFQKDQKLNEDGMKLLLKVQHMLVKLYVQMHLPKDAETYCRKGLETAQSFTALLLESAEVKLIVGQLLCRLCLILLEDGRLYQVPGLFREFSPAGYTTAHPCAEGTVLLLKAIHKLSLNESKATERCFKAALTSRKRWYGPDHPLVAEVEERLADLLASSKTDTDSVQRNIVELYRHVIRTKEAEAQQLQLDFTVILVKLGKVLLQSYSKAERREGLDLLQRAADLRVCLLGSKHPLTRNLEHVLNTDIAGLRRPKHPVDVIRPNSKRELSLRKPPTEVPQYPFEKSHRGLQQSISDLSVTRPTTNHSKSFSAKRAALEKPSSTQDEILNRPWMVFQVSVFGPQSDIMTLMSTGNPNWFDRRRSLPRSAGGGISWKQQKAGKAVN